MDNKELCNYTGSWHPPNLMYNLQGRYRQRIIENDWQGELKENYIIKDEEADYYNMKGKGPFMMNSFGQYFLKPSVMFRPYPYFSPYSNPFFGF